MSQSILRLGQAADAPEPGRVDRDLPVREGAVAADVGAHVGILLRGRDDAVLEDQVAGPLQGLDHLVGGDGRLPGVVDDLAAVLVDEAPPLGPPAATGVAPLLAGDGEFLEGGQGVVPGPVRGRSFDALGIEEALVVVHDHRAGAVRDRVELVLVGVDVRDRSEPLRQVHAGLLRQVVERQDLVLARVDVDVLRHLHDVRALAARDHRLHLLGVAVTRDQLELHLQLGELLDQQVDPLLVRRLVVLAAPHRHHQVGGGGARSRRLVVRTAGGECDHPCGDSHPQETSAGVTRSVDRHRAVPPCLMNHATGGPGGPHWFEWGLS